MQKIFMISIWYEMKNIFINFNKVRNEGVSGGRNR